MKQDQRRKIGEMAVIKEDSFSDHRPIAIAWKCQVKEMKRRGTEQAKRLDLSKFENEEMRRLYQTKPRE